MLSSKPSLLYSRIPYKIAFITLLLIVTASLLLFSHSSSIPSISPSLHKSPASSNVAVIVDTRAASLLVPLILHFSSILGPSWPILLFTTANFSTPSAAFHRNLESGSIQLRPLPSSVFEKHTDVSTFMTTPWLWEQLLPAEHALVFQLDSIICSNSAFSIEDFLGYDFIGAPIKDSPGWGLGFNGGLSLRNVRKTLQIINENDWAAEVKAAKEKGLEGEGVPILDTGDLLVDVLPGHGNNPRIQYEDQWFFKKFMEMSGAKLPALDVSKTFSVESLYFGSPFGYHKPSFQTLEEKLHLESYCPEYKLATKEAIIDA